MEAYISYFIQNHSVVIKKGVQLMSWHHLIGNQRVTLK